MYIDFVESNIICTKESYMSINLFTMLFHVTFIQLDIICNWFYQEKCSHNMRRTCTDHSFECADSTRELKSEPASAIFCLATCTNLCLVFLHAVNLQAACVSQCKMALSEVSWPLLKSFYNALKWQMSFITALKSSTQCRN